MNKNKKLLLIKPPYAHIPIGMAYVMSVLNKEGIPFDFHDMFLNQNKDLQDVIKKEDYFCIATGGLIGDFRAIKKITCESKKVFADVPVILGGGITNDMPDDLLFEILPIDYAVFGEAETSLPDLLKVILEKDRNINDCNGVMFRDLKDNKIIKKVPQKLDLDEYDPLPFYKYVDMDYYINNWDHTNFGKVRAMPILTGRGCKGKCSFCSPTLGYFRKRKYENVLNEIEEYNRYYDPNAFMFINEILYQTNDEIIEFCQKYKDLPGFKPWMCLLRADIDPKVFPYMRESGCFAINIGIESGSDRILKKMRKGVTLKQNLKIIQALKKSDFIIEFSLMLANESETEEELKSTIDLLINEEIVYHTLGLAVAYPGTHIYRNAIKRGQIEDREEYINNLEVGYMASNPDVNNLNYINISGISDDIFWETVFKQYRRYSKYLYKKLTAKNQSIEIDHDLDYITMSGFCPQCGTALSVKDIYSEHFLNLKTKCSNCCVLVFFNPYEIEEYKEHYQYIKKAIEDADKVVINGTNGNASALFLYDMLDIKADKIVGFIEIRKDYLDRPFFHFPKIDIKNSIELPSSITIVNAKLPWNDSQLNIYLDKTPGKILLSLVQLPENAKICIYGSGTFARKFNSYISDVRKDIKMCCFIDSFKDGYIEGKDIIKFDVFLKKDILFDYVVIASTYYMEIFPQLVKEGLHNYMIIKPENEFYINSEVYRKNYYDEK